jgi:hypothetical protein
VLAGAPFEMSSLAQPYADEATDSTNARQHQESTAIAGRSALDQANEARAEEPAGRTDCADETGRDPFQAVASACYWVS